MKIYPPLHDTVKVFATDDALLLTAAERVISIAAEAIKARGRFILSLSGEQTLDNLYALLAKQSMNTRIDWLNTFIFWSDERYVRFDNETNNAHKAVAILFNRIVIPSTNIYIVNVNLQPDKAAAEYEKYIKDFFKEDAPRFDLVLLGVAEDGHTAALFPGSALLKEQQASVRDVYREGEKMYYITMTAPLINRARHVLFLVTGAEKSEIVKKSLMSSHEPARYPAQLIKPNEGDVQWYVDKDAAALLSLAEVDVVGVV